MTNAIVEPFNEFRVGDMGNVPTLRMWKHVNTVSLEWNDCGVIYDDLAFKNALDSEAMNAELNAIWRSHMSQCDRRRATFSWGIVGGHMDYVPQALAVEAMDAVRRHYTMALEKIRGARDAGGELIR